MEYHAYLFNECEAGNITINKYYDLMQDAGIFYSQPFNPALIEKCFEGITAPINGGWFVGEQATFQFEKGRSIYWIVVHGIDCSWQYPLPSTLDQFITDFQRARIDLTFSPYSLSQLKLEK